MAVISKERFVNKSMVYGGLHCDIIHPWTSNCLKATKVTLLNVLVGTHKTLIPIYLLQALLKYKNLVLDKNLLKRFLVAHRKTVSYALCCGFLSIGANCAFSHLAGNLHYYNVGLGSGILAGLAILFESKENKLLYTIGYASMVVESTLRNLHFFYFKATKLQQVIFFSLINGALMTLLKKVENYKNFTYLWFFGPPKSKICAGHEDEQVCFHEGSCNLYSYKGFLKYFAMGCGLNILKTSIPQIIRGFQDSAQLIDVLMMSSHYRFGLFMGSYVGIYRYLHCLFLEKYKREKWWHATVAGMVSGTTYTIIPNIQVFSMAITTIIQILFQQMKMECTLFDNLPVQPLIFMISNGLLLHNFFFAEETCPPYYAKLISACTSGLIRRTLNNINRIMAP